MIGVLYGLGAVGQTLYCCGPGKILCDMADGGRFRPTRLLARALLVANSVVVTFFVIGFEAAAAVVILT